MTRKRLGRLLLCIFAVLLVLSALARVCLRYFGAEREQTGRLYVYVLSVGQSDAVLLRCDGEAMLIDAGTATERAAFFGALRRLRVEQLSHLVITHPHEDHFGNARELLSKITVENMLIADTAGGERGYELLLSEAALCGTVPRVTSDGESFTLGGATVQVLRAGGIDKNENNNSMILKVTYGKNSFLFMGDCESGGEQSLVAQYGSSLQANVLKVGHHGSNTSTTEALLTAVKPKYAVISCGTENDFGFPHSEVLQNLAAIGATVLRTDLDGTITLVADGEEVIYDKK